MTESWRAAWTSALDDLELTLEETEHILQGGQPPADHDVRWTPPVLPGPLPADLADRARALLARQQDLVARTARVAADHRSSAGYLDRLAGTRPDPRIPLYVDVSA